MHLMLKKPSIQPWMRRPLAAIERKLSVVYAVGVHLLLVVMLLNWPASEGLESGDSFSDQHVTYFEFIPLPPAAAPANVSAKAPDILSEEAERALAERRNSGMMAYSAPVTNATSATWSGSNPSTDMAIKANMQYLPCAAAAPLIRGKYPVVCYDAVHETLVVKNPAN